MSRWLLGFCTLLQRICGVLQSDVNERSDGVEVPPSSPKTVTFQPLIGGGREASSGMEMQFKYQTSWLQVWLAHRWSWKAKAVEMEDGLADAGHCFRAPIPGGRKNGWKGRCSGEGKVLVLCRSADRLCWSISQNDF